jgi:hypothetical protein
MFIEAGLQANFMIMLHPGVTEIIKIRRKRIFRMPKICEIFVHQKETISLFYCLFTVVTKRKFYKGAVQTKQIQTICLC